MGSKIAPTKKANANTQIATSKSTRKQATVSNPTDSIPYSRKQQDPTSWAKVIAGAKSTEGTLPANSAQYWSLYPFKTEMFYDDLTVATFCSRSCCHSNSSQPPSYNQSMAIM